MRTIAILAAGLAGLAAVAGAPARAADPGVTDAEIKLGDVNILSGPASFIGRATSIGSKIAAAEINAAGGVAGRKIVFATEDDGYVPSRSFQALKKLIESDGIFALNGTSGSANVLAMLPLIEENKLPTVVTTTPNELVYTPVHPTVFTIGATYQDAFYAQTKYIHDNLRRDGGTYAVIRQDDEFGAAVEAGYDKAVKELKLKDALRLKFKRGTTNFGAEVLQMRAAGVNALINGGIIAGAANILSEARKLNMDLAVGSVWSEDMPPSVKLSQPANYAYLVADYVALNDAATDRFLETARKYLSPDEIGGINRYSYITYVGVKVLAKAMAACGRDLTRDCAVTELRKIKNFDTDGLTAPISFDNAQQLSGVELKIYQLDPKAGTFKTLVGFKRY